MRKWLAFAGAAIAIAAGVAGAFAQNRPASAPVPAGDELAWAVHGLLQVKCAQCHGPKGGSPPAVPGLGVDVHQFVESGKIVPGKPEDSPLYNLVSLGIMPKQGARNGGLSAEQLEWIRLWIAAGAPAPTGLPAARPAAGAPATSTGPAAAPAAQGAPPISLAARIGRFHIQLVHFPVALLLAALLAEILHRLRPAPHWRASARFCLWTGALGAIAAVATGWLLAENGSWTAQQADLVETHESLGVATAIGAVALIVLGWVLRKRGGQAAAWAYLAGALCVGALVSVTGHYGGLIVWGREFFRW